jgi:RimJ/RimL family protein N-acetyltransferase
VFYLEAWATLDQGSGAFVGMAMLQQPHEFTIQVGGWMAPDHRDERRIGERAQVLTAMAHQHLGYKTVIAAFHAADQISIAAYRSIGYHDAPADIHALLATRLGTEVVLASSWPEAARDCPGLTRPLTG